jgi:hypothetical protein
VEPAKEAAASKVFEVRCTRANMMTALMVEYPGLSNPMAGVSHNVSFGGMGFYCEALIPSGTEVSLRICYSPENDFNFSEMVKGTVKWCKRIGKWYGVGVQFKDLDPQNQPLLYSYIDSALKFHHVQIDVDF